jgi:integrase
MYIEAHPKGYRCHVEKNGQRASKVWPTKTLARDWGRIKETEFAAARPGGDHTFGQAVERYKREVSSAKPGEKWECLRLDAMLRYFGDVPLTDLQQPQIAAWRDFRLNGDSTHRAVIGSTVLRERNLLHNVITKARDEWKWIEHDPFKLVDMPKDSDPRTAIWDWKRILAILRFLGYRQGVKPATDYQQVALAFMVGLHTSLRASEILRVNKTTLNAQTRIIRVKTKTIKVAQIPITKRALKVCRLADFTITAATLDVLFRKARDATQAGNLTFHDSRAFALTMLAARVDIKTLARISQHKDLNMLMRYFRETPEQIAARI